MIFYLTSDNNINYAVASLDSVNPGLTQEYLLKQAQRGKLNLNVLSYT